MYTNKTKVNYKTLVLQHSLSLSVWCFLQSNTDREETDFSHKTPSALYSNKGYFS